MHVTQDAHLSMTRSLARCRKSGQEHPGRRADDEDEDDQSRVHSVKTGLAKDISSGSPNTGPGPGGRKEAVSR